MDIDQLIITLVEAGRQASEEELDHIIEHVARAPFASHPVEISRWLGRQGSFSPCLLLPLELTWDIMVAESMTEWSKGKLSSDCVGHGHRCQGPWLHQSGPFSNTGIRTGCPPWGQFALSGGSGIGDGLPGHAMAG